MSEIGMLRQSFDECGDGAAALWDVAHSYRVGNSQAI
jgi:hypothetical protein